MIKLQLPVHDVYVTQPFGVNYLDFYKQFGLKGHNGLDLRTRQCYIMAAHGGEVVKCTTDSGGGKLIEIYNAEYDFKTLYYHLKSFKCKLGDMVSAGQIIGISDNTGKYTTGDHLHFGLKFTHFGVTLNKDNGYNGAVDPALYLPKNWDKSNSYHRYGRKQEWMAEYKMRFLNPWLHRQLIKRKKLHWIYKTEFINALVYGGWDFDIAVNEAYYASHWGWLTKTEFTNGEKPFT